MSAKRCSYTPITEDEMAELVWIFINAGRRKAAREAAEKQAQAGGAIAETEYGDGDGIQETRP